MPTPDDGVVADVVVIEGCCWLLAPGVVDDELEATDPGEAEAAGAETAEAEEATAAAATAATAAAAIAA